MNLKIQVQNINTNSQLKLTGSKSETNRLLLLQALFSNIILENSSISDDSEVMAAAIKTNSEGRAKNKIDIHHAGTAMRFLTAFFAIQEGKETILTGSARMKQRPVKILVDALKQLGADITYIENEGFPPVKITGKNLTNNQVTLSADVSSQYISALLLIAPKLVNGIEITLVNAITSVPYIKMTLALLNEIGVETHFDHDKITVKPFGTEASVLATNQKITIESDWSSASYFYSIIALSPIGTSITLSSFKQNSLQADSVLADIYKAFGVKTTFVKESIVITKTQIHKADFFAKGLDCSNCPDIAQTIAVTAFGLGARCHLTGLHTLKIKETDRLEALKTELTKLGAHITVTNDSLTLEAQSVAAPKTLKKTSIATYQDHRMAMAFAPLALKRTIQIEDAEVVSKSFPTFWNDLRSIGFEIREVN